jgi:hypothetical protein
MQDTILNSFLAIDRIVRPAETATTNECNYALTDLLRDLKREIFQR